MQEKGRDGMTSSTTTADRPCASPGTDMTRWTRTTLVRLAQSLALVPRWRLRGRLTVVFVPVIPSLALPLLPRRRD